ncbi:MAG: hypothetical protein NC318_00490 [Blautia sp.]|nr:hypothetical protein [Muribaculaceae bacterium]MCM1145435.1 hypothetical protein [Lachnoclostridium sp.]MCM1210065.1 hypothetical protein [Blautia sp.]
MGYATMDCPHCGKQNKEKCNAWMYGSPIRICKNCGRKYTDRRYREVAIQGFDPRSLNAGLYLKGLGIFALGLAVCLAWMYYQVNYKGWYPNALLGCIFACAIGVIGCIACLIRSRFGIDEKQNARYLEESRNRLADKAYVQELIACGVDVPEEYR